MARVTQADIDQRIAAYGGSGLVHSPNVGTQKIPNPAHGANGGTEWMVPKEIDVQVQRWKGADGAEIEAYQLPGTNEWEITKEQPAPAKPATAGANNPASAVTGATVHIEGTPDPSKPGGFDNERPVKVTRDASGKQVGLAVPLAGPELEAWRTDREKSRNPGNKSDADIAADAEKERQRKRQEAADAQAAADRNKPGAPTLKPDGKGGTIAVQVMPDGSIRPTPLPGVPSDKPLPALVDVGGVKYERGPDGTYKPAAGIPNPNGPLPEGAPPPSFTVGNAAQDLHAFDQWLNTQVRKWYDTGGKQGVSPDRADKERENRRKLWEVGISESQGIVNTQTSAYGQQVSQRGQTLQDLGNRRSSATQIANQASGDFMPLATKLGAGGGGADLMQAINQSRINAQDFVTLTGANRQIPEIAMGPALTAVNTMPLPGTGASPGFLAAARPNAIGLGQGGTIFRPQPVAPPPVAVASPPPTAGEPGGPPLAAGPVAPTPPVAAPPAGAAASMPQAQAADGNEQDDDILTVQGQQGQAQEMTRAQWNALPNKSGLVVTNARPNPARSANPTMPTGQSLAPGVASPTDPNGAASVFSPVAPVFTPPSMASPGVGATGAGSTISEPLLPHERVPVNPPAGAPGNNPNYPVGMMPTASPGFLSAMRPGGQPAMQTAAYDPTQSAMSMIADPSWDNEAVKEAYRQLYNRELQIA